ncbi:hypothetical protein CBR_g11228 [Chara braunii]|uniref:Uncharacterized protein n=1 Tax=Chara braunii TaxID=69332 RepID=A0A388KQE7_CHABU|nr:hypothetical protein CBR_g11228 [Chara braunii]|eukprot:GBG72300.1 hypothetical protein CBR_g11228 [Chara braunii]
MEDRVRLSLGKCYDGGVFHLASDLGEVVEDERGRRFRVNESLDAIKEKWLKERMVIFIFQEESRNLARGVKEDMVRAYEDGWFARRLFSPDVRRDRIKFEGPNVISYVAKAVEVATWLVQKGSSNLNLKGVDYPVIFKPWMMKGELKELRFKDAEVNFWITALRVPLEAMYYLPSTAEGFFGGVKHMHPPEANRSRPKLMNIKLDMDTSASFWVDDTLTIESPKGEVWKVEIATPFSDWCRKCRWFFHMEENCPRNVVDARPRKQWNSAPHPRQQVEAVPASQREASQAATNIPAGQAAPQPYRPPYRRDLENQASTLPSRDQSSAAHPHIGPLQPVRPPAQQRAHSQAGQGVGFQPQWGGALAMQGIPHTQGGYQELPHRPFPTHLLPDASGQIQGAAGEIQANTMVPPWPLHSHWQGYYPPPNPPPPLPPPAPQGFLPYSHNPLFDPALSGGRMLQPLAERPIQQQVYLEFLRDNHYMRQGEETVVPHSLVYDRLAQGLGLQGCGQEAPRYSYPEGNGRAPNPRGAVEYGSLFRGGGQVDASGRFYGGDRRVDSTLRRRETPQFSRSSNSKVAMGSELQGDELLAAGINPFYEEKSESSTNSSAGSRRRAGAESFIRSKNTRPENEDGKQSSSQYDPQLLVERRMIPLVCTKARYAVYFLGLADGDDRSYLPSEQTEKTPTPLEVVARTKRLFGESFPIRVVPRSSMVRCVVPLQDKVYKLYFPIVDARIDPSTADSLTEAGVRWFPLEVVWERNSQKLEEITLTPEVSALLLLKVNDKLLDKENLHSTFLMNALADPWRSASQSAQSQSSNRSSMLQSPPAAWGRWADEMQESNRIQLPAENVPADG